MIHMSKILMATTLFSTITLTAQATSMQEAVASALSSHPQVKVSQKNMEAIGHAQRVAEGGFYPTVDLTAGTGWEHSNNSTTRNREGRFADDDGHRDLWRNESRLLVRQMLYDGWGTSSEVAEQGHRKTSAKFNVLENKEVTALAALEAYLNVMRTRELVALGRQNVETHEMYLNQISARVDGGRGTRADRSQAEGRLALAKANLIAFEGELRSAEADYLEVIGNMPNQLHKSDVPFGALPGSLETALTRAMENNPAIDSAQYDIKAADAAIHVAESTFCPRFDLEGNISRNVNLDGTPGTNNDASVMLMMRYNLYNGGSDTARVKERVSRKEEAKAELEQSRRSVEENTMVAWSDLQTSRQRLSELNNHVTSTMETRQAYRSQFDLGKRTLLDLLDNEVELFNARTALINGKYGVDLAAYNLLASTGDLVDTVSGVQTAQEIRTDNVRVAGK